MGWLTCVPCSFDGFFFTIRRLFPAAVMLFLASGAYAGDALEKDISAAFKRVARLEQMADGREYSLKVGKDVVTGGKDLFLRRRTPREILAGGVSSGGGDYAAAFYWLLDHKGYKPLFIDSVELSLSSLMDKFSGREMVAVKDPVSGKWTLTDPAAGTVISGDWDPASKTFRTGAGNFWIAYSGSLKEYPCKTPAGLGTFYTRALAAVPPAVWNSEVVRLRFTAESAPAGRHANPHMGEFLSDYSSIYGRFALIPKRYLNVHLLAGEDGAETSCGARSDGSLECRVGGASAMGPELFKWIERHEVAARFADLRPVSAETPPVPAGGMEQTKLLTKGPQPAFKFFMDNSLKKADGGWLNPYFQAFRVMHDSGRGTPVYFYDNGPGPESQCDRAGGKINCRIGRNSGLGPEVYNLIKAAAAFGARDGQ